MFRSPLCLCCRKQWVIVPNRPKNFGVLRGSLFNDRMSHFFHINIKVTSHFFCFPLCPPIPLCKSWDFTQGNSNMMSSCMCVCVVVYATVCIQYFLLLLGEQVSFFINEYVPSSFFQFAMLIIYYNTTSQCNRMLDFQASLSVPFLKVGITVWLTDCLFNIEGLQVDCHC